MDKVAQLDALIDAVEAGDNPNLVLSCLNDAGIILSNRTTALKAYHGSLDAALALHEALLPVEWEYAIYSPSDSYSLFQVQLETPAMRLAAVFEPVSCEANTPARAWLLAILKAYRAKETDNATR